MGVEVGRDGEETNMAPYRDKWYHTLSNVTRKAKNFTSSRGTSVDDGKARGKD